MHRFTYALALAFIFAASAAAEPRRTVHDTPTRVFDIQHRALAARFDFAAHAVSGNITLSGQALDSMGTLVLDANELEVSGVSDSTRGALTFGNDGKRLSIRMSPPLRRGERTAVTITYRAKPRAGLYWVTADADHPSRRAEVWSQGEDESNRYWFPDFDEPAERAATDLYYTVPAPMFALGNGHLVDVAVSPDRRESTYHWREEFSFPSYLVMVAASAYARVDTVWRGKPVQYFVPPDKVDRVRRSFGRTPEMLDFFSERLGVQYPYEKYAQVVVQDFTFGGMENLSATTMVERILLDRTALLERTQEGLIAHELGHQWFGDYITCREWAHAWLNEGFATFMADLWWEHAWGRDEMDRSLLDERASYFSSDAGGRRPLVEPNYRFPDELFDAQIYQRGGWTLHMLRRLLGDDAFFRGLRHYLETRAGRSVDTDEFRHALEESSGRGLDGFFDQWATRAGYPDLTVSWEWFEAGSLARVTVLQTQPSDSLTPVYRFDLPVRVVLASGEVRTILHVDGRSAETYVRVPSKPRYVEVNDDLSVLCRVKFDRPVKELAAQLQDSPLAASRIEAARALGEKGVPESIAALRASLAQDRFYAVRQACAEALGKIPTPAGFAALAPGLRDADARVRHTSVAALGGYRGVPGAIEAARAAVRDPAYGVVSDGLTALARLGADDAFAQLSSALARPAWDDVILRGALSGFAELGDPRALPLLIARARRSQPVAVRTAAIDALGKLGRRLALEPAAGKTTRREVRLVLEPYLWDDKMAVRRGAAAALGELGDGAAGDALARLAERDPEERVVAAALAARSRLRADGERGLASLRDEMEKLKDRNRALELRIQSVEEALKK